MSSDALGGARANQRLRDEHTAWLTTVRSDGQPQTSPVGFMWDGAQFVILTQPNAPKVRNLRMNGRVSLHLDTEADAVDGGVLTIEGIAELDPRRLAEPETSAYVAKYLDDMRATGFTPEEALAEFSQVIRVTPTKARMY
jgi:PPOX class probable F420-dependent enzyme